MADNTEIEALRAAVFDAMPNRCCEDWRTCPYDQHEGGQILDALLPQVSAAWEAGFGAGMSQAHSSLNRMGYIERGRDEGDAPNPYSPGSTEADGTDWEGERRAASGVDDPPVEETALPSDLGAC